MPTTLHIIVPVYNEPRTLEACLRRVVAVDLPPGVHRALCIVDDCSEPEAAEAAAETALRLRDEGHHVTLIRHHVNRGKGAALQTAFDALLAAVEAGEASEADLFIIQDADLEYDPVDHTAVIIPLLDDKADAVIGARWGAHRAAKGLYPRIHELGNRMLTLASNLLTGYRIADMECCYKAMPLRLLREIRPWLTEERFGIEPQIVAALSRCKARVVEVPVRYDPRTMDEGKKIGWRDGVEAFIVIARERFLRSLPPRPPVSSDGASSKSTTAVSSPAPPGTEPKGVES